MLIEWPHTEVVYAIGSATEQGKDGRLLFVPRAGSTELLFIHAQKIALVQVVNEDLEPNEAINLLLYWYINEQDE